MIDTTEVFNALEKFINQKFINQRSRMDSRDYGTGSEGFRAYRSEARSVAKDGTRARAALRTARALMPAMPDVLADSFRAFGGRLEWKIEPTRGRLSWGDQDVNGDKCTAEPRLSYCTGCYFPTEYRKAAASVLETYVAEWKQA